MKQRIQTLLNQLNHGLVEREDTLKTALLTVLAREHLVLIGPPGTGKSLIARRIAESLAHDSDNPNDSTYFEYLLTKFSTPEEIFGPLSIAELKADRFKRNTAGYLPTVRIAFLDEIFKASSSILNALLTILNERKYHNGSVGQDVPLQALIAASNELPNNQEELSALYDRFLVRSFVDYVSEDNLPRLFENAGAMPPLTQLTVSDLNQIQRSADTVTLPNEVVQAMQRIWQQHKETFKEDRRESLSDRRLKKVIKLLCVSAATNGRSQVDLSDVFLLKNCLWNHQDNAIKVRDLILSILRTFSRPLPQSAVQPSLAAHNEQLTYEVAEDGKSLVPAQSQTTAWEVSPALAQSSAKRGAVVKGFKGSGTAKDPLLIRTVEDLMDLGRPEVGLQGYCFRQTADLDCSVLSSWANIPFQGHYDGDGHTIKYKKTENFLSVLYPKLQTNVDTFVELFSRIHSQSSITKLKLEDLLLAGSVENSDITHCMGVLVRGKASNCTLVACESVRELIHGDVTECTISACKSHSYLIAGTATNCTISTCESGGFLIGGAASNCNITDCLVAVDMSWSTTVNHNSLGGISKTLESGSVVERCFVTGTLKNSQNGNVLFSGITSRCSDSTIRRCAIGRFEFVGVFARWTGRIISDKSASTLENNVSIDNHSDTHKISDCDGKTVAAALFTQRYFEHTLGWNFDAVWQWDGVNDRPALRSIGTGASADIGLPHAKPATQAADMVDLLTQQMSSNIWL